ncbi:hypothetical protein BDZ89DRAFT_1059535 [Hymenopellis radicata]|nr:hypothetical protein BDZ89DRAFT_1059535 [Hymenopellis radicata]
MASRSLWLGFGVAKKKFKFHAFEHESMEDKFDNMFEPFPFTSPEPLLILPHEPQMNDSEGTPRRFPYPQVLAWGDGLDNESSVFFTGYHGEGNEQRSFCVKVLFNIEKAKPDECCYQAFKKMLTDAKFYAQHLRDIAGNLVPRHYGVWRAPTGKWGGTVLCIRKITLASG